MPDPNALPSPEGSWTDLLPALGIGAASLASGFAMGRNPGVDNPANVFFQALQIPAITEQRLANAQHQRDMQGYYQNLYAHQQNQDVQARLNTAMTAAKQAAEMGDVATVDSMKDQLGPYYTGLAKNARFVQQMVQQEGGMGGGQGLPTVPTLGPGAAAMPVPQGGPPSGVAGTPQMGGGQSDVTDIPFRPGRTRNLSIGKFSFSTQTPGTTPQESVSGWMQRRVQEGYQGVPPSIDMLMADLSKTNEARQARGLPPIAPTDRDITFYREWQRRATPGVWQREQLQERATQVEPEIAHRMLQTPQVGGQGGQVSPFEAQRGALREDYAKRERIAAETPKKPDAGELETLRQQRIVINELQNLQNMALRTFKGQTPTGPVQNKVEAFSQYFGWSPKDVVTFRSGIQNLMNVNLRVTSGQNVTGPEEARAKAAFPTLNDPPPTLLPKLNYALKYMRMAEQAGRGILQEDGLRLLKHMGTPQGIQEALQEPLEEQRVIQWTRDPATGKLVPQGQ